jgi:hypothetical protein
LYSSSFEQKLNASLNKTAVEAPLNVVVEQNSGESTAMYTQLYRYSGIGAAFADHGNFYYANQLFSSLIPSRIMNYASLA